MATVADRLRALSADDKALAKRIVHARQAKAQLAVLEPKIAETVALKDDAEERLEASKRAMEQAHKERSGMRGLFLNKQKKAQISAVQIEATFERTQAYREADDARRQLATFRQEKAALDKDVSLLRKDDATRERVAALLAAVFDAGPTPDFPEHERLREAYEAAKTAYDAIQTRVSQQAAVVNHTSRASGELRGAITNIQGATKMAEREAAEAQQPAPIIDWGYASFMTNDYIKHAKQRIDDAEAAFAEARAIDPEVGASFKPAADEKASDVDWTEKPITAYLQRHDVSVPAVEACVDKLEQEVERGNSQTNTLVKERDPALRKYDDLEKELRDLREKILEEASEGPL